jgi:hypothetical protein
MVMSVMLMLVIIASKVCASVWAAVMRFFIGVNRHANRSTQSPTNDRTIATADLIPNGCSGGTADASSNCRVQGRITCNCWHRRQCKY